MKKLLAAGAIISALAICATSCHKTEAEAVPGNNNLDLIVDTDGNPVNCHGGGLLITDSIAYWYGEHRPTHGFVSEGVSCYSTTDFRNWRNEGVVLSALDSATAELGKGCIIERPKVVYNAPTGKYVMWFHHELPGQGYAAAHAGVAVSDSPTGPFTLVRTSRVNPGIYPLNFADSLKGKHPDPAAYEWWTPEWYKAVDDGMLCEKDVPGGQMSRDMTIFVDTDGTAYHVYSSEENLTLNIAELTPDYTNHTGRYIRIMPAGHNEAPTVFRHGDYYWMITSGCTGWNPNEARMMRAKEMMGEWEKVEGTPFVGEGPSADAPANLTFGAQGTYVADINGQLVFIADQWRPDCLASSRNYWLPIAFTEDGVPQIAWAEAYP